MVGAEMPMTSDQVIWSEQNRLHIAYDGCSAAPAVGNTNVITIPVGVDNVISVNDTVVVLDPSTGGEAKCLVSASAPGAGPKNITVQPFNNKSLENADNGLTTGSATLKVFVYGSAYQKGVDMTGANARVSVEPQFTQYSNTPIIIRSQYVVNGSDMAQIGWVEVATEDGTSGYLWYLKAESETRLRFEDYLEMSMVEGEKNEGIAAVTTAKLAGTEGLFAAIEDRGNVNTGFTAAAGLDAFDAILKNLDTQ